MSRSPCPAILTSTLGYVADMNTPVAMILMGTYLARLPLRRMLDRRAVGCVLMRLVVIPAAVGLVFWLMPVDNLPLMTAVFLTAATRWAPISVCSPSSTAATMSSAWSPYA